ncbi:MAG TPA: hypothetical protein VF843_16945, partial [Streptosporangiaceae bacterium]
MLRTRTPRSQPSAQPARSGRPDRRAKARHRSLAAGLALAGPLVAAAVTAGPASATVSASVAATATPAAAPTSPPPVTILTSGADHHGGDFFISPFGDASTYANGPEILSPSGKVVWIHPVPAGQEASDFRAQTYRGQRVLTWWQ